MTLVLSDHLRRQARRHGIDEAMLRAVAAAREQVVPVRPGREVRQTRFTFPPSGDSYPVPVVVEASAGVDVAVTA